MPPRRSRLAAATAVATDEETPTAVMPAEQTLAEEAPAPVAEAPAEEAPRPAAGPIIVPVLEADVVPPSAERRHRRSNAQHQY